jgi:hypothetical protein
LGLGSGRIGFSELQNDLELAAFDNFSEPHRLPGMLGTNPCPETNLNGRIGLQSVSENTITADAAVDSLRALSSKGAKVPNFWRLVRLCQDGFVRD